MTQRPTIDSLDSLHDGGGEAAQRTFGIVLLFEWTLDGVGEEESFALEFGEQGGLSGIGGDRDTGGLHELFEKPPGAQRAIGRIQSGAVEVIFDTRGRRSIEEKDADSAGSQSRCKLDSRSATRNVSVVRSCPAPFANRQPPASAQERKGSERMSRAWQTMQVAQWHLSRSDTRRED